MKISKRQLQKLIREQTGPANRRHGPVILDDYEDWNPDYTTAAPGSQSSGMDPDEELQEQFANAIAEAVQQGLTRGDVKEAFDYAWDYVESTLTHTPGY